MTRTLKTVLTLAIFGGLIALQCLALAGCKKRGAGPPETWSGIPQGKGITYTCAWNQYRQGTCVGGGQAYLCVHDYVDNHYECAPAGSALPLEATPSQRSFQ